MYIPRQIAMQFIFRSPTCYSTGQLLISVYIFAEFNNSLILWPVLVVIIVSKRHMPVGNVNGGIKIVVKSEALPSKMRDMNNDANDADINEVAAAEGL